MHLSAPTCSLVSCDVPAIILLASIGSHPHPRQVWLGDRKSSAATPSTNSTVHALMTLFNGRYPSKGCKQRSSKSSRVQVLTLRSRHCEQVHCLVNVLKGKLSMLNRTWCRWKPLGEASRLSWWASSVMCWIASRNSPPDFDQSKYTFSSSANVFNWLKWTWRLAVLM